MLNLKKGIQSWNNFASHIKNNYNKRVVRKFNGMSDFFLDKPKGNPLLYEVFIKKANGINFALTVIKPGKIGREFYMTKGHYHAKPGPELYVLLKGRALLLLQNKSGLFKKIKMEKGKPYLVPDNWAHRVVNIGKPEAQFVSIYSDNLGHDYGSIKEQGFKERIMEKYIVGIDLGGTYIKSVLTDQQGRVLNKAVKATRKGRKRIVDNIIECIKEVSYGVNKKDLLGVGVGVPGIIDRKTGKIIKLPNISGFEGFDLKQAIKNRFKVPVEIDNDSNRMAVAEGWFGAGKGVSNFICLTIGTGVGSGIIIDGKLYTGKGKAGEAGDIIVEPNLKGAGIDKREIEEHVSVRAVKRLAKQKGMKTNDPEEIARLARKGNKKAKSVYSEIGRYLGIGLADIASVLDPELILLGGGLAKTGNLILDPARKEMRQVGNPKIEFIKLGDFSGAVGAACLFL